jgi:hypothetical protein
MGMPGDHIQQHLKDFGCLMTWAVGRGFAEWGCMSEPSIK